MLALSLVALMINSTGCQEEAAKPVGAAAAIADPGPEQAFQLIVEFFKREVDSGTEQRINQSEGAYSKLQYDYDVEHEFIPPENDGEPYRGTITVRTESTYTYRPALGTEEASESSDAPAESGLSAIDPNNLDNLDSLSQGAIEGTLDLGSSGPDALPKATFKDVTTKDEKVFHLEYEDDRWVLKTEPDPETESFIKAAFDFVLKRQ